MEYRQLAAQLDDIDAKLMMWHRANECSRRLAQIPGVGPVGASLLMMNASAGALRVRSPVCGMDGSDAQRPFDGWKEQAGIITRAGDEALRSTLVVGATALLQHVKTGRGKLHGLVAGVAQRKPPKLVAVALANKIARIAWKMMMTGEAYRGNAALPPQACAA